MASYLQIPPSRSKEFWTRWKIEHIRKLAETGRATDEIFPPYTERSSRILDRIVLREGKSSLSGSLSEDKKTKINLRVPFTKDSKIDLTSPLYLGDMSFGALSGIPNIAIAFAAEKTGIMAGTGEGGLLKEVANCSRITVQWASARFGVDSHTLSKGQAVVIKIGQGAKPGIGGHLPGAKVTEQISHVRRIPVGKDAISPAPHHDIYSIEDLGQRIVALKEATNKPILVKVGATNYIPYIASGIARMGASGIIIDGAGAGTGAAPSVVKDNVGIPIELAVASVDSALRTEGFREKFTVIAAGRVSTPEDSVKLIALGADITSLGTAALISLGCIMVHKCHLGYCPAVLTNKITSSQAKILSLNQSIRWLSNLVHGWNEEMTLLLEYLGLSDVRELRGRRDLLRYSDSTTLSLNDETMEILGMSSDQTRGSSRMNSNRMEHYNSLLETHFDPRRLWTTRRVAMLREMAGTIGKIPGEAEISSMGTTAPPIVEEPMRISDYLVSDGAQVTRPSIDPYREEIETTTFLSGIDLRLSSPFFFAHLPDNVSNDVKGIFARVASTMGLIFDLKDLGKSEGAYYKRYNERIISDFMENGSGLSKIVCFSLQSYFNRNDIVEEAANLRSQRKIVLLRCPSSRELIAGLSLRMKDDLGKIFCGIVLDEDDGNSPLEMSISFLDQELKKGGLRNKISILAESNSIRGSDDIFKLLGLGADAVGFGVAGLKAMGYEEGPNILFDSQKSIERLENFALALQKDIKLLAGASGISSVASSLVGNRELLRAVDLDSEVRKQLDVKPAGAG